MASDLIDNADGLRLDDDHIPFRRLLGIKVLEAYGGRALLSMPWQPGLGNRFGKIHGGAITALIDAAIANAIASSLSEGDQTGATIELSTRFVASADGNVQAEARSIKAGGRIAFGQAEVYDAAGNLVATGQATYAVLRDGPR